jgi:FtsH-binding integral membrane protein
MSDYNPGPMRDVAVPADMSVDAGLRSFMLGVYNKVALGLVVSAGWAWLTSSFAPVRDVLFRTGTYSDGAVGITGYTLPGMILAFAPLAVLFGSGFLMRSATTRSAGILYWTIVSLIGASFGALALFYTGTSIFLTFLITATAFGALSLYGYTTKRDLKAMGSFMLMGAVGLLIAMVANWFIQSGPLAYIISGVGVLIFAGLTAWDTQNLKLTYYELGDDAERMGVATNFGALHLYLDFVNLFRFLLMFLGVRRS